MISSLYTNYKVANRRLQPRIAGFFQLEFVWISLVLIGMGLIFFSGPLLDYARTYYSPVDMLQGSPVFAVGSDRRPPHNYALGDDIYAYLPWIEFSWRSLRQGELPLWNPYNAGGRPLLANMQSSIFYPSQWPGFFFGVKFGLLARCFMHFYLAGLCAYYFFRSLKVQTGAALAGAVAFMSGGMMVVWLYNELSATFLLFPLLLLVLERRLNRTTSALRFVIELGLCVMLQIFGGHPETIFLSISLGTCYLLFRLLTDRATWPDWSVKVRLVGQYILGGLLGAALGAIQLLPFIEYLRNSYAASDRSPDRPFVVFPGQYLFSFILPNPFGNPTFGTKLDFTRPNYTEVSGSYVGPTVLFLAFGALVLVRRRALAWFFWLIILVIIQLAYDIGPLHLFINQLLPVTVFYTRLMGYAGFFLVALMVLTLDSLGRSDALSGKKKLGWGRFAAAGGVFLAAFAGLFWWFSQSGLVPFDREKVSRFEMQDFLLVTGLFGLSLGGVILLRSRTWQRRLGFVLILVAIFGQLGMFGRNYRSAVADTYFYPDTPAIQAMRSGGGRIAVSETPGFLPAEANIWYGLEQVNGYDSLEVRWFEQLRRTSVTRWPRWDNPASLNLFNIKQVLAASSDSSYQGNRAKGAPQLSRSSKQFGINIFSNQLYQPTYRMVYHSLVEPEQAAIDNLLNGQINPLDTLVFVDDDAPPAPPDNQAAPNPSAVEVIHKTADDVVLHLHNPQAGFLYIDQTYFPGWEARINGRSARLYRANVAFTALPLDQGDFNIELSYAPLSFRLGALITFTALILTVLAANYRRLRRIFGLKLEKEPKVKI